MIVSAQVFRVAIPSDVERDEHVKYCLRSQTVCLQDANGMFITNCPVVSSFGGISGGLMGALEFPENSRRLGSEVLAITPYQYTIPVVIGVMKTRTGTFFLEKESSMKMEFNTATGSYHLSGDGVDGLFNIFLSSTSENGGKLNVDARNSKQKGEIKFATDFLRLIGEQEVHIRSNTKMLFEVISKSDANTKAQILYELATGLDIIDEFGNYIQTRSGKIELDSSEIKIGSNAVNTIAKGDIVELILDAVFDVLQNEKVPTIFGASPLILSPVSLPLIKQSLFEKIQSKKGKVE